ncbi:MAG: hypothetical protein AAF694_04620 [Bacteroidota bacterium]
MKTFVGLALSFLVGSTFLFSQTLDTNTQNKSWKLKKLGISLGSDQDMIMGMDHAHFLNQIRGNAPQIYEGLTFEEGTYSSFQCENPQISLNLVFLPNPQKNMEVSFIAFGIWNRIDAANYYNGVNSWDTSDPGFAHLSFDSSSDAVGLQSSIDFFYPVGNWLRLYAGGGTALEYSFNRDLNITGQNVFATPEGTLSFGSNTSTSNAYMPDYAFYELRNSLNQRVFAQVGLSFIWFKRVETGVTFRGGFGYRAIHSAPLTFTRLQSFSLNANWLLK